MLGGDAGDRRILPPGINRLVQAADNLRDGRGRGNQKIKAGDVRRRLRAVQVQHVVEVFLEAELQRFAVLLQQVRELHLLRFGRDARLVVGHHDAVLRELVFVQAEAVMEAAPCVLRLLQSALAVVGDLRVAEVRLEIRVVASSAAARPRTGDRRRRASFPPSAS